VGCVVAGDRLECLLRFPDHVRVDIIDNALTPHRRDASWPTASIFWMACVDTSDLSQSWRSRRASCQAVWTGNLAAAIAD
jgi:hypothetical protein